MRYCDLKKDPQSLRTWRERSNIAFFHFFPQLYRQSILDSLERYIDYERREESSDYRQRDLLW